MTIILLLMHYTLIIFSSAHINSLQLPACNLLKISTVSVMKVNCKVLSHIKLDQSYSLLSVRDVSVILELFKAMDVRGEMALDGRKIKISSRVLSMQLLLFFSLDIQFYVFMHSATDLSKDQIYRVFDMLDVDNSGLLDFDEFYLLVCILLAVRVW